MWYSVVVELVYVISRIVWVKTCVVVYGPTAHDDEKKREKFWNDLDRVVDIVGNRYGLCAT